MPVKPLDITDRPKRRFFRFPHSEVINFILISPYTLTRFSILIEPENENTDDRDIENHPVRLG
jgi:hypothetical protein